MTTECSKIRHYGIYVRNIDKCIKFYESLGFKIIYEKLERWPNVFGNLHVVKMMLNNQTIEMIRHLSIFPRITKNAHICLEVDKIELFFNSFKGKVVVKPRISGNVAVGFIKDPNGNLVEIVKDYGRSY